MFKTLKRLTLATKITLLFLTVTALISTAYTVVAINRLSDEELQKIDLKLMLAAHKYVLAVDENNFDRAINNTIDEEEYKTLVALMGDYAHELNLAYLYSTAVVDSKVKYVIDGSPQEDIVKGEFALPGEDYEDASPKVLAAWDTWTPQFDEYTDQFGHFRSYFMPLTTKAGNKIIVCVDMEMAEINQIIKDFYKSRILIALGIFVFSFILSYLFARMIAKRIIHIGSHINHIAAKRDFTKTLVIKSRDEIGEMSESINSLQNVLNQTIGHAHDVSVVNASSAEQFSSAATSIQSQVTSTSEQVEQLNERAVGINKHAQLAAQCVISVQRDIDETSGQLSDARQALRGLTDNTKTTAQNSRVLANDLKELNVKVSAIGRVLETVAEISDQTNLLAINASIEAAHAGSIGKGFAVVAGEVRNLANSTQKTVEESGEIVRLITQGIDDMVAKMAETVEANEKLATASNRSLADIESMHSRFANTTSIVAESVASTTAISSDIASISKSLGNVDSAMDFSKSQADQILTASYTIRDNAKDLKDNLSSFKVS